MYQCINFTVSNCKSPLYKSGEYWTEWECKSSQSNEIMMILYIQTTQYYIYLTCFLKVVEIESLETICPTTATKIMRLMMVCVWCRGGQKNCIILIKFYPHFEGGEIGADGGVGSAGSCEYHPADPGWPGGCGGAGRCLHVEDLEVVSQSRVGGLSCGGQGCCSSDVGTNRSGSGHGYSIGADTKTGGGVCSECS